MLANSVLDATNTQGIGSSSASSASAAKELGDNFMTMLVAQIKNQDPLNPLENAELTSQLAQINTVSGIEDLNATLNGINSQIEAGYALQAAGVIGHGVMVAGDRVLVGEEGATTPFGVELETPADQLVATIVDGSGVPVRSFDLGAMDVGYQSFVWDGTLETGEYAPAGAYQVVVEAFDGEGNPLESSTFHYAVVQAVSTDSEGDTRLDLGGIAEQVSMQDVRQIL